MVRAGEKIKYCSVGHLVGHIYFALSIETLNKGQKCGRKLSERLEACQGILTIKREEHNDTCLQIPTIPSNATA